MGRELQDLEPRVVVVVVHVIDQAAIAAIDATACQRYLCHHVATGIH